MSTPTCIRCLISGRVQGVYFRASTREQALRLGLQGWADNLSDGRVEVVACGMPAALEELRGWLRQGPAMAEVVTLSCEFIDPPAGLAGFSTGHRH